MGGRSITVALLVAASVLLFIPVFGVSLAYLFMADGISWHTVYGIGGGILLLAAVLILWRRFWLPG